MSTTDLIAAAVLFSPGIAGTAAYLTTQRGWRTDSAAVHTVLAESAAHRDAATNGLPPQGGEPAPKAPAADPVRLATIIEFPAHRRAA